MRGEREALGECRALGVGLRGVSVGVVEAVGEWVGERESPLGGEGVEVAVAPLGESEALGEPEAEPDVEGEGKSVGLSEAVAL